MVWVKLDDEFYTHPKVADLRSDVMLACVGLHTLTLCWCNHKLTDGIIPINQVFRLAGDLSLALPSGNPHMLINELVRVNMWEVEKWDESGHARSYRLHDFLDYQPSKAQYDAERLCKSEGGKKGMAARWGEKRPADNPANHAPSITPPISTDITSRYPVPVPVPDLSIRKNGRGKGSDPVENPGANRRPHKAEPERIGEAIDALKGTNTAEGDS